MTSALILNCTLTPSPEPSSSQVLAEEIGGALAQHDVTPSIRRVVDLGVRHGVALDEGDGDGWPRLREEMLAAEVLVLVSPIWLGQPSSVAKMVLERLNAELSETDDEGRLLTYGKVAGVGVVGNEDGAHHVSAELFQGLDDVGFTLPPDAITYWVGEAMQGTDYRDLDFRPESTAGTTATLARNLAHLAAVLSEHPYPAG